MAVVERTDPRHTLPEISRSIVIVINGFMVVISLVIIALSIWTLSESRGFFANGFYVTTGVFLLVSGVGCLIISILAIKGVKYNIRKFVTLSISFFIFFFTLSVIALIVSFIFRQQFKDGFREKLYESTRNYFDSYFTQYSWDILQSRFKCCGLLKSTNSYTQTSFQPNMVWSMANPEFRKPNGPRVPESCCDDRAIGRYGSYNSFRMSCQGRKIQIYREDCYYKLESSLLPRIDVISFAAVAMTIMTLVGIIFSYFTLKFTAKVRSTVSSTREHNSNFDPEASNNKVSNNPHFISSSAGKFNVESQNQENGKKGGLFSIDRRVDDAFKRTASFDTRNPPNINSWQS